MLHECLLFEQRCKVPVRSGYPVPEVIQAEVTLGAFVKARAWVGSKARTFPTMIEVDWDTE
jgi:hypothetical protein